MIVERRFKVLVLVFAAAVQGVAAAQRPQPAYTLSITKEGGLFVNLTAQEAKLSDVAEDLAKKLNAKVIVGASLKEQRISAQIAGTPLEPAMLAIAQRVFVDYELRRDAQPAPLGIYLLGFDDPDPATTAVVQGTSQGLFISGNTEDTGQPPPDAPLRITYKGGRLTVFAKEQPLIAVALSMADELGVPAEIKRETREVISVDIKETAAIEDAFLSLSEDVRVYVRANANRVEKSLLRVVIGGAAAAK